MSLLPSPLNSPQRSGISSSGLLSMLPTTPFVSSSSNAPLLQSRGSCSSCSVQKSWETGSHHSSYVGYNNLWENVPAIDNTFLRELFLKRLPGNVRMILVSTASSSSLDELADLADKIMDVVVPSVSALQPPPPQLSTEVDQLRTEVTRLKGLVKSLTIHQRSHSRPRPLVIVHLLRDLSLLSLDRPVGTTRSTVPPPESANPPVTCQTARPHPSGDER